MTILNEETLKQITGDIADEAGEATYRVAATKLIEIVEVRVIDHFDPLRTLMNKDRRLGEALISFVLAAALELLPTSKLGDARKRLAYNLRVRAYEKGEEFLLRMLPIIKTIEDEAARALLSHTGLTDGIWSALFADEDGKKPSQQTTPAAAEAPGKNDGQARSTTGVPMGSEGAALAPASSGMGEKVDGSR